MSRIATSEADARAQLRTIVLGAAKARSNALESLGASQTSTAILATLEPWLFGPRCVIEPIERRLADSQPVTPAEYRNWLVVALRLAPSIAICSTMVGDTELPFLEDLGDVPAGETWPALAAA